MRRGAVKYHCASCGKWFQFVRKAPKIKDASLTLLHLSGIPFRTLGEIHGINATTAYRHVKSHLDRLPHCADITREYCQSFSGILLTDGKYIAIKGYDRKIPVVYGIDYTTHDIPHYILSRAENYSTCLSFFRSLKLAGYLLQAVVCDDNKNIYETCRHTFPQSTIQLCQVHYLRNLRFLLDLDHQLQYHQFFAGLCELFSQKRSIPDFDKRARFLFLKHAEDQVCRDILLELERKKPLLLGYHNHKGTPTTTNLIESFNSHLQNRLDSVKGFESFSHADAWLNAYFLRRRTKKFTDCTGRFRRLNGKTSLSQSQKPGMDVPIFF